VEAEKSDGNKDVFYAEFDHFPGGYVSDGHPSEVTHRRMADQIFAQFKKLGLASDAGLLRGE
jgi:hypothetical protein